MASRACRCVWILCAVVLMLYPAAGGHGRAESPQNLPELEEILKRTGAYCDRLGRAALYFVCRERVEEESRYQVVDFYNAHRASWGAVPPTIRRHTWIYDYQLIKEENRYDEKRCLLEENGRPRHEDHARLKTHFFYSQRSILGPVGLLQTANQKDYDYRVVEKGRAAGRNAWVLEVRPRESAPHNPNYGKVWVDREDFSVLKIEVEADSLAGYVRPRIAGASELPAVVHLYGVEKNGLRFPSETLFSQKYDSLDRFRRQRSRLTDRRTRFTYSGYRFFTVEVDVRFKGDRPG